MRKVSIVFNDLMRECRDLYIWLYWDPPAFEEAEGEEQESIKAKYYELIH